MEYRTLGSTGIRVSEIGFGGWPIGGGWGARDDTEALRALRRALDLGITFFDTALGYGESNKYARLSEQLVAEFRGGLSVESLLADEFTVAEAGSPRAPPFLSA